MRILKIVLKNFLVFFGGSVIGVILSVVFAKPLLTLSITKDVGLGIIALAPVVIIFWMIVFGLIGGILAIVSYNIIKRWRGRIVV